MNTIEYWKIRCRLAEELLMETPHSLSETDEQKIAHDRWNEFKTLPIPDVMLPNGTVCKGCFGRGSVIIFRHNMPCKNCDGTGWQTDL